MILVLGYGDPRPSGFEIVETTSRSKTWSRGLSPFLVGPVDLPLGRISWNVENAWQYSKVYPKHWDRVNLVPTDEYWDWANAGWADTYAHRYPMGKGVSPVGSWWYGRLLGYVDARKQIYIPLYSEAVVKTAAFAELQDLYDSGRNIALIDFDGYNRRTLGLTYGNVVNNPTRKMGHAFVLSMLLEGFLKPGEILK